MKVADYIEKQAKLMRGECGRVRKESVDGIHDMRVSSRRLRVALREARTLIEPRLHGQLQEALATVTEALGHARELDVMTLMMEEYVKDAYGPWKLAAEHALCEIRAVRKEARHGCAEAVRAVDTAEFDALVRAALDQLRKKKRDDLTEIGEGLVRRLREVRRAYRDWRESEEAEDLHRVRIALKKLRYALEFYIPAYDKNLPQLIDEIKAAQEMLGDWHDADVLCDALERIEKHAPYREVQGFPLIIEAFHTFGETRTAEFQDWARAFFSKARREEVVAYILGTWPVGNSRTGKHTGAT